jgi:peptidoglycan/LPS O-acetylase OafA/YrhL
VDYLASDSIPSAVQHYWSLAVEEQYYVSGRSCSSVLLVVLSALPAWASHRWVEQPIHKATRGAAGLGRSARPALVLGLALSLAGVGAGLLVQQKQSPLATTPAPGQLPPLDTIGAATLTPGSPGDAPRPIAVTG